MRQLVYLILLAFIAQQVFCDRKPKNKYSAEANQMPTIEKYDPDFRNLQRPFRMAKLNLVWVKAQHRLTEPKLKSLYTELKIHDKEELAWKQLNAQHHDKDGIKEGELRKKLIGIMSTYGLLEHFEDTQDPEKYKAFKAYSGNVDTFINKSLFKDKKLNRLWEKAEMSGFTPEELKALKQEFEHHQEKIDMYYSLLENGDTIGKKDYHENAVNEDEYDKFNEISAREEDAELNKQNDYLNHANLVRDHHRNIKDNFERLERVAAKGPNSQDFVEPKVQGLWKVALNNNFSAEELSSLKVELLHYESRLLKLRHLNAEHALSSEKYKNQKHHDKHDKLLAMEEHIKKQSRKVERFQEDIEKKIYQHGEL